MKTRLDWTDQSSRKKLVKTLTNEELIIVPENDQEFDLHLYVTDEDIETMVRHIEGLKPNSPLWVCCKTQSNENIRLLKKSDVAKIIHPAEWSQEAIKTRIMA